MIKNKFPRFSRRQSTQRAQYNYIIWLIKPFALRIKYAIENKFPWFCKNLSGCFFNPCTIGYVLAVVVLVLAVKTSPMVICAPKLEFNITKKLSVKPWMVRLCEHFPAYRRYRVWQLGIWATLVSGLSVPRSRRCLGTRTKTAPSTTTYSQGNYKASFPRE